MTETQKNGWFSAAFVVIIALLGINLWKVTRPDDGIAKQLAAVDAKIDATNAALAKAQKAPAAGAIDARLNQLDAKIGKIGTALTEIQKGASLKSVGEKLDALNAGLKSTDTALAGIQKSFPQNGFGDKLDAIGASLKSMNTALAGLQKSAPVEAGSGSMDQLGASIKNANATLASIQEAMAHAGKADTLQNAVGDLKKNIDEASVLRTKLADGIAKLDDAIKTAAKPKPSEVVVVYLDMPDNAPMPRTVATVSPLSIQFKAVGSADDDGQAAMIAAKLSDIVKDRKDCTISVAGYADTLGGDKVNLSLSKKRARVIAAKLKSAFAGKPVQINEAAWGERRLADWTPDETAREANRRVDVAVSCKK